MDRDPKKVIYIGAYKYISAVIFKYSGPERRTNPITARMIPMKSEIKALNDKVFGVPEEEENKKKKD